MQSRRAEATGSRVLNATERPIVACWAAGAMACLAWGHATAQVPAAALIATTRPVFSFDLGVQATATSNAQMSASTPRSDLVTELTPHLRWTSRSGMVTGSADYAVRANLYARNGGANELQHNLAAAGTLNLPDQRMFVDASASVSQAQRSALGTRSADSTLIDSNRTEVASIQVSPYVRGR
jgi:uncharacterized protein (PEP-CTERM system associated)